MTEKPEGSYNTNKQTNKHTGELYKMAAGNIKTCICTVSLSASQGSHQTLIKDLFMKNICSLDLSVLYPPFMSFIVSCRSFIFDFLISYWFLYLLVPWQPNPDECLHFYKFRDICLALSKNASFVVKTQFFRSTCFCYRSFSLSHFLKQRTKSSRVRQKEQTFNLKYIWYVK